MSEITTTSNGFEIEHPTEKLDFTRFKDMVETYGIVGSSASERVASLKKIPVETVALFMTDLNKSLQGSETTLVHESVMKIGDRPTIEPQDRYDIFSDVVESIKKSADDVNPARIGDALALATVLLHPFKDGNGRTARVMGYLFHDYYDAPDAEETFNQVATSRDEVRARGDKNIVITYVPDMGRADRSNPDEVKQYLKSMLKDEDVRYMGLGGEYAHLKAIDK